MRKNQKYTQEEMYMAIELWKESGLSQQKYCSQNHIAYNTFKYWVKKYQQEKGIEKPVMLNPFLPVKVESKHPAHIGKDISITYPNGIEVRCSGDINVIQLKNLLTII